VAIRAGGSVSRFSGYQEGVYLRERRVQAHYRDVGVPERQLGPPRADSVGTVGEVGIEPAWHWYIDADR